MNAGFSFLVDLPQPNFLLRRSNIYEIRISLVPERK